MTLFDMLARALRDQDDLDELCGPDPGPPPPPNAAPLTAEELITSPVSPQRRQVQGSSTVRRDTSTVSARS